LLQRRSLKSGHVDFSGDLRATTPSV
jgi:hypothetical protein